MRRLLLLFALNCLAGNVLAADGDCHATGGPPLASAVRPAFTGVALTGGQGVYHVRSGDNLTLIGARLGTSLAQLMRDNPGIDANRLRVGQGLNYENRHIVPPAPVAAGDAILVNIPQRMLFHYRDGQWQAAYPVAAGKPDWQTPVVETRIQTRIKNKAWVVPPSIQAEMSARGERVLTRVPPGPDNPLGGYWLGLELQGYGIHGTNAPASVYSTRTHGCIRLQLEHVVELFGKVQPGVPVSIVYAPVLLFAPPAGPIWLEAHPDAYARGLDYPALVRVLASDAGVAERMDSTAVDVLLQEREGLARAVDRASRPIGTPTAVLAPQPQP
jgi:L,D-transpeptidase ErfK/SrfK